MHRSSGRVLAGGPASNDTPAGATPPKHGPGYDEDPYRPPRSG